MHNIILIRTQQINLIKPCTVENAFEERLSFFHHRNNNQTQPIYTMQSYQI